MEKQAITTSKWDFFDAEKDQTSNKLTNLTSYGSDDDDDEHERERITPMSTDDEQSNQHQKHEKNGDSKKENGESDDEDIDGEPIDDQDDSRTKDAEPNDTQTQTQTSSSMTTKKPDETTQSSLPTPQVQVTVIDEEKRKVLREIEVKVVKYIDEIESGKVRREQGLSIQEQAEKYRQELIRKVSFKNNHSKYFF